MALFAKLFAPSNRRPGNKKVAAKKAALKELKNRKQPPPEVTEASAPDRGHENAAPLAATPEEIASRLLVPMTNPPSPEVLLPPESADPASLAGNKKLFSVEQTVKVGKSGAEEIDLPLVRKMKVGESEISIPSGIKATTMTPGTAQPAVASVKPGKIEPAVAKKEETPKETAAQSDTGKDEKKEPESILTSIFEQDIEEKDSPITRLIDSLPAVTADELLHDLTETKAMMLEWQNMHKPKSNSKRTAGVAR